MKNLLKLSALAAILLAAASYASADTLTLGSYCVTNTPCSGAGSNNNTATVFAGFTASEIVPSGTAVPTTGISNTFNVTSNSPWHAAVPGSQWISYDPGTGCCGGPTTAPNGFYSYYSAFTLTNAAGDTGSLFVLADDTTDVYLNGNKLDPEATGPNGNCEVATPDCTQLTLISLTGLRTGLNILEFDVNQTNLSATGLDFAGSIVPTPEPSTLLMLGTGLIGSAGALFRRMSK